MKNFYHHPLLVLPAGRRTLLAFYGLLLLPFISQGQSLSLSLSATNNTPNNCYARTISVSVSGGSGSYAYFWSSSPPSSVNLGNGPSISVSPAVATTYTVAVWDNSSSLYAEKSILISPRLAGNLSVFIPSAFLAGNLWRLLDSNQSTGPLNAYRYELSIINDWGNQVYAASGTTSSGTTGLLGGQISWNGRLNGTGNYVPSGNYFCDLRLINCSTNTLYKVTVTFFNPSMLTLYPNPAASYVEQNTEQERNQLHSAAREAISFPAEIELLTGAGRAVYKTSIDALPVQLDVRMLQEGDYVLVLRMADHTIKRRLLIRR
ncbi:hypothetical protein [Cesiribacter sp. SM1]|uniref:hypothetical protein n=1 Tax=Cesiribacter sp. SM1 TaxID=2861196 RepID=UPI001CD3C0ED|nr:hypothetical protein [Cesiribacter sp. SM1]